MIGFIIFIIFIAIGFLVFYLLIKFLSRNKSESKITELVSGSEIAIFDCPLPKNNKIELEIGDKFNTWNKPNTSIIHLFEKGTVGGQGKIAEFENKSLSKILQSYDVDGIVIDINEKEFKAKLYIR